MANLGDIKNARDALARFCIERVLIYGAPKTGKTTLAASVATLPQIKKVIWLDVEYGGGQILSDQAGLTQEQLSKIELIQIPDLATNPMAAETVSKFLTTQRNFTICETHGKVNCQPCKVASEEVTNCVPFNQLGADTVVVIDTLSALSSSILTVTTAMEQSNRNKFARYTRQGEMLNDALKAVQAAKCHVICITHQLVNSSDLAEEELTDSQKIQQREDYSVVPLVGTRNFSLNAGKYFNSILHTAVEGRAFRVQSNPATARKIIVSARNGADMRKEAGWSLSPLFTNTNATKHN